MGRWLCIAAINGAAAVALGAFAAHGFEGHIEDSARAVFETGARYHMYHALALGIAALAMRGRAARWAQAAAGCFLAGILLFSGSLYLFAIGGPAWLVFVTPLGGLAFLGGWGALAFAATRLDP